MSGVRETLAVAVKRANIAYAQAPEPKPAIFGSRWAELEAEVDAALATGDDERARGAIAAWCEYVDAQIGAAP